MAGTKAGAQAAVQTNLKRHGSDFYARIGARGGKISRGGGFAADKNLARIAGAKGGRISRRKKAVVIVDDSNNQTPINDDLAQTSTTGGDSENNLIAR